MSEQSTIQVPIKEYIDLAVSHECELREANEKSSQAALDAAKLVNDARLESMNELRAQIFKERGQYIGREMFDRMINEKETRLRIVEGFKDNINGRMVMIGALMAILNFIILALMAWWTRH